MKMFKGFVGAVFFFLLVVGGANAAQPIFFDDFSKPEYSKTKWDLSSSLSEIVEGQLILKTAVAGQAAAAGIRGSEDWADYSMEFSLMFRKKLPDKGGHAGIRFLHSKQDFIYVYLVGSEESIVWMEFGGSRRSGWKRVNIQKNVRHQVKVIRRGPTIEIFLDGRKELDVTNVPFLKGSIELFSYQVEPAFSDIKVFSLEPVQGGVTTKNSNIVSNSSFEAATWAPNLPDYWGLQTWGLADEKWIGQLSELWNRWKRTTDNPYDGKYCMQVDGIKRLASTEICLKPNKQYVLSAYLRSDVDELPVKIIFYNDLFGSIEKVFNVSREWKRYSMPVMTERARGFISFQFTSEGILWVDAVQMEEGSQVTDYHAADSKRQIGNIIEGPILSSRMRAYRIHEQVDVDGMLKEAFWLEIPPLSLVLPDGSKPSNPTQVYVAYDEDNLYLGFKCFDSQIKNISRKITERDGFVWKDDSVEIFLDTWGVREDYYHLGVSVTGAVYDAFKHDSSRNLEWQAKTALFPDRWEVEIALPFAALELSSLNRGDWAINIGRENHKAGEYTSWSPTSVFHSTKNFGVLEKFPDEITCAWVKKKGVKSENALPPVVTLKVGDVPFLPFGINWSSSLSYPGDKAFLVAKEAGFNAMHVLYLLNRGDEDKIRESLNSALRHGIKVIFWIGGVGGEPTNEHLVVIKKAIEMFKDHQAIIAWMILDEPHANYEKVVEAYELAKKLDTKRPSYINLTPTGLGMRVAGVIGDVISVDPYAINFDGSTIRDVGTIITKARREAAGKRPVWAFLQGASNFLQVWRGPTPEEQTAQTYLALISGATGIFYFGNVILPSNTWQRTLALAREVRILSPILTEGIEREISGSNPEIKYTCRKFGDSYYLIAVNPYPEKKETVFDLTSLGKDEPVGEDVFSSESRVAAKNNLLKLHFGPYQRYCYKIQ